MQSQKKNLLELNAIELENHCRIANRRYRKKYRESWYGYLEYLNKKGEAVWSPLMLGNQIIGVRKIRDIP